MTAQARPRGTRRGGRGSALVEMALISPLLLVFLAGVLNYGFALRNAAAIAGAARAGAQYGSIGPTQANDAAGIRAAALNSAPTLTGMTVSSAVSCQCPSGGAINCGSSCVGGNMSMYVQVTVNTNAATWFSYTGLPFASALQAQATMRAQ